MLGFILCLLFPIFANKKEIDLEPFEKKIYSQNGEDGITLKIFESIGTTNKYFVEFGVETGIECNTRILRETGWNGLMMDGRFENQDINLHREFITTENINELFKKYGVPNEFDCLSIDVDYNDFFLWHAIRSNFRPRVIIIEVNTTHLPTEDKVCIYNPNYMWDITNYFGASILALKELGEKKGYTLVYAENRGVNLFFIRNDVLTDLNLQFKNQNDVIKLYKQPTYGLGPNGGHYQDPLSRQYITSTEAMNIQ